VNYKIVLVDIQNYPMFDDMIFFRKHERFKTEDESNEPHDFTEQYAILEKQLLCTYAVEVEDNFVGYVSAAYIPKIGIPNNNGYLYVDDLWINPSFRRMGLGEALLNKAEDYAKEKGLFGLRLYVNTANDAGIALYKKCGYSAKYGEAMLMEKGV
jgi:ribosomal protein S18 acetylase RimI-like enzyme